MQYIQPPWENYFFSKVQSVEKSLYLSSPYIKNTVATLFYEVLRFKQNLNLSIQILTRIRIQDLIDGASDLEAFEKLLQLEELEGVNAEIRCISNLHAKVYIFDQNSAIVTSSNLTLSGLKSNIEYGIEVTDPTAIQQMLVDMGNYWDAAETLTTEMLEQVAKRLETTESIVKVDQAAQQTENHSLTQIHLYLLTVLANVLPLWDKTSKIQNWTLCVTQFQPQNPNTAKKPELSSLAQKIPLTLKMNLILIGTSRSEEKRDYRNRNFLQ